MRVDHRTAFAALSLAAVMGLAGFPAVAAEPGTAKAAGQACKTAEVNPVTGHVLCIDPLGAEVAPAPPAQPCKTAAEAGADWTWHPSCKGPEGSPAKAPGAQG